MDKDGYHGHDKQPPKPWKTPISSDYERGFIDGMQKQAQSSVDRAVNAMTKPLVGLTPEELSAIWDSMGTWNSTSAQHFYNAIWKAIREKNT